MLKTSQYVFNSNTQPIVRIDDIFMLHVAGNSVKKKKANNRNF